MSENTFEKKENVIFLEVEIEFRAKIIFLSEFPSLAACPFGNVQKKPNGRRLSESTSGSEFFIICTLTINNNNNMY